MVIPARPPDCYLEIIFQGQPAYAYAVLGRVWTDSSSPSMFAIGDNGVAAIRRMREKACAIGADGLMTVTANSQRVWAGKGSWKTTTAAAVAFIYVDANGRRLPPRTSPTTAIQPTSCQSLLLSGSRLTSAAPPAGVTRTGHTATTRHCTDTRVPTTPQHLQEPCACPTSTTREQHKGSEPTTPDVSSTRETSRQGGTLVPPGPTRCPSRGIDHQLSSVRHPKDRVSETMPES